MTATATTVMRFAGRGSVFDHALRMLQRVMARVMLSSVPTSDWRHHGIGCLQAYLPDALREAHTGEEVRLHVWDPSLVLPGIHRSGAVHDHRFDLFSTVLLGSLEHVEYEVEERGSGIYEEFELVHARASQEATGSFHTDPTPTGRVLRPTCWPLELHEGDSYAFAKHHYHCSRPRGRVVTLVGKSNQSGNARMLRRIGEPYRNAFGNPDNITDPAVIQAILEDTSRQLLAASERP